MERFLEKSDIIDFHHPKVAARAKALAQGCEDDVAVARRCFEFVRDEIRHTGDYQDDISTLTASEVLEDGTGWCYAKSHLLAALLRANGIPTALCYQRLSCSEYEEGVYCLHGLNAVHLSEFGWYRIDARGNKEGVDAQFDPPEEKLAFTLDRNEYDLPERYAQPLEVVVEALGRCTTYAEMVEDFPDIIPNTIRSDDGITN